jgi:hypothetical protein
LCTFRICHRIEISGAPKLIIENADNVSNTEECPNINNIISADSAINDGKVGLSMSARSRYCCQVDVKCRAADPVLAADIGRLADLASSMRTSHSLPF